MEANSLHEVHNRRKNKAAAPVGALVLLLAISGIVALMVLGLNLTERMFDNTAEKQKFEKIVQPVLMFDPPAFEDVGTLDRFTVLQSALWATMLGEKRETYAFDPQGNLIVPASDVDVSAAKLLGPQLTLEHQAFSSDFGMVYDYNESTKAYHIPVQAATALYTPRVDEIVKNGDAVELLVAYIPPGTAWNTDITGKKTDPDPHKFMIYKLKKAGKNYQLTGIADPPPEKQITFGSPGNVVMNSEIAIVSEAPLEPEITAAESASTTAPAEGASSSEGTSSEGSSSEGSSSEGSSSEGSSSEGSSSEGSSSDDGSSEDSSSENSSSEDSSTQN